MIVLSTIRIVVSIFNSFKMWPVDYNPVDIESKIEKIKTEILNLDEKVHELTGLLGPSPYDEPPSSLFIYGDSGTGKTMLVKKCLELGEFACAFVNCLESYSMKVVFENVINQLTNHKMTTENEYRPYVKCNNVLELVLELKKISLEKGIGQTDNRSIIIVFDKCEMLRNLNKNIIPALVKLRELSELKLCVVFVSCLPWNNFFLCDYVTQPITLFLEQYDQKCLHKILQLEKPENISIEFYDNFVSLFLSVFYNATHDVRELRYQIKQSFLNYYEPILKGELTEKDAGQLWKRCQAFFKKALRSLYLKVDCNMELSEVENITSVTTQALIMELPYYSKYILIGSYIASYNPASEDKKIFVKNSGKQKKTAKLKSERTKHHLLGPKAFGLQRLFAIVSAILSDDKFALNADLFVEVSSLVRMKLLTQISEDTLEAPTFKCNVGLQFVDVISRNVQFPIRKYLVDFMDA